MNWFVSLLLVLPAAMMLAMACLPSGFARKRVVFYRRAVTFVAGLQSAIALVLAAAFVTGGLPAFHQVLATATGDRAIALTVHYDGVSALMFALVAFVGWVICRYSMRYLDGESTQGRYFRWTSFTIGSVCLMVVSGNLIMFMIAWVMTSSGLHRLLLHYADRPAARRAAWNKFTISRLGDAALLAAIILIYREIHTFDFADLFAAVGAMTEVPVGLSVSGFLLVIGAMTKSAQFPLHTWLPLTMETPTPVSALMHAGIVNAGGFLIIRMSPLVVLTPAAMTLLALVGGITACFAAMIMLTQTSVKKSLAYSTIAQMGFMMLQCGLGAFSAAMLHIVAHSLYKAHAFLSSGSVINERAAMNLGQPAPATTGGEPVSRRPAIGAGIIFMGTLLVVLLGGGLGVLGFTAFGSEWSIRPGGLLLGGVLVLALGHWIGQVALRGDGALVRRAVLVSAALCVVYSASYLAVDAIVAASLPVATAPAWAWVTVGIVWLGFGVLLVIHSSLRSPSNSPLLNRWHIHASNGFYIESTMRRLFGSLVSN